MPKSIPSIRVLAFAIRRRLKRALGITTDASAATPPGLSLSPSARHFSDYERAPLKLRIRQRVAG